MADEDLEEMRRLRQAKGYERPYESKQNNQKESQQDDIYASLPMSFGKKKSSKVTLDHSKFEYSGTALSGFGTVADEKTKLVDDDKPNNDNEDEDEDVEDKTQFNNTTNDEENIADTNEIDDRVPATHSVLIGGHTKTVSAIAIDRHGQRMLTGSFDYSVRFFQFSGMNALMKSFREIEPADGYQIMSLDFSRDTSLFVVATTSHFARLYDREGFPKHDCIKGDSYIYDKRKTKGHTAALTDARFALDRDDWFYTTSTDCTLRRWNTELLIYKNEKVAVARGKQGRNSPILCFAQNNKLVGGGTENGDVLLWAANAQFQRPQFQFHAHNAGENAITCVAFSPDNRLVCTRSATDSEVALWDIRKAKQPIWRKAALECVQPTTACGFAPLSGCATKKGQVDGHGDVFEPVKYSDGGAGVVFAAVGANPKTKERGGVHTFDVVDGRSLGVLYSDPGVSAVDVKWNPSLQQLFVGQTDGSVRAFYRPGVSRNGVVHALSKGGKKKSSGVVLPPAQIHLPNAHEKFIADPSRKRQMAKDRQDKRKTRRPDIGDKAVIDALRDPASGVQQLGGGGGAVAAYLVEQGEFAKRSFRAEDPREALLKFADKKGPSIVSGAYAATQPQAVFDYSRVEDEEEEDSEEEDGYRIAKKL